MEPAVVAGTVTTSDLRSQIRIETLRDKNSTEIYCALSEVCSEFTVGRSTVFRCANRFRGNCGSTLNDTRPGRTRISTDERSVKLVADALEEDRRASFEEVSRATGAKTSQKIIFSYMLRILSTY